MASHESEKRLAGFMRSIDNLAIMGRNVGKKMAKTGFTNAERQLRSNISDIREETPSMPYEPGAKGQDRLTARIEDVKVRVEAIRRLNFRNLVKDISRAAREGKMGR